MEPYYEASGIMIYHGDCREVLPVGGDVLVTDPPYLVGSSGVPIRGRGVAPRAIESEVIGMPWGYDLGWIDLVGSMRHYVVFAHFAMLGELCTRLDPSCVFVWRKSNAPRMTRPVPRMDCEFIVWSALGSMDRMGLFDSMVIDHPMLQAGCMADERILVPGSGRAFHRAQKPLAMVGAFVDRTDAQVVVDPFMGTGTTLVAAKRLGRKAIGIDIDERNCEVAALRLSQGELFNPPENSW